jgi:hypothetical protein
VIAKVKEFASELEPQILPYREIFHHPDIHVDQAGTIQDASARIPELPARRDGVCVSIEPSCRISRTGTEWIYSQKAVGPLSARSRQGIVAGDPGCEREAGLGGEYPR